MANKRIYTGPSGGKYIINSRGKKQYLSRASRGLPKQKQVSRNGSSDARKWQMHLPRNTKFCGPAGGAARTSYPVNTPKRCSAALSYARFAKRPCGIVRCALAHGRKMGWSCGKSSSQKNRCQLKR